MKIRIEFCQNSTGLIWFVDVLSSGGWKNAGSFRTEAEALKFKSNIDEHGII